MNEQLIGIITDILVIIVIIVGILWKAVKDKKTNGSIDLQMIPGHSKECERRGIQLTQIIEKHKFLVESVNRTDTNISNLWNYVKNGKT